MSYILSRRLPSLLKPSLHHPLRHRLSSCALPTSPSTFLSLDPAPTDSLLAIGGLYGNPAALRSILSHASKEGSLLGEPPTMCFNGDFHFFDFPPAVFTLIHNIVLNYDALAGNVELALAGEEYEGCGCDYPPYAGSAVAERADAIVRKLRSKPENVEMAKKYENLPTQRLYEVGGLRVGVLHGDFKSVSGWSLSAEQVLGGGGSGGLREFLGIAGSKDYVTDLDELDGQMQEANLDVLLSSHTCLPFGLRLPSGRLVVNNGSAGIPNFDTRLSSLVTRVSTTPFHDRDAVLYSATAGDGVHIEAVEVAYDVDVWEELFERMWPEGSEAYIGYADRIGEGVEFWDVERAGRSLRR
mmetsp:Transcript_13714/g.27344  ORF Transcript_13714/g.27344 Transcript_13714/m.27344 type:complete len:355 (+) Transcript_13714:156-1220(+)